MQTSIKEWARTKAKEERSTDAKECSGVSRSPFIVSRPGSPENATGFGANWKRGTNLDINTGSLSVRLPEKSDSPLSNKSSGSNRMLSCPDQNQRTTMFGKKKLGFWEHSLNSEHDHSEGWSNSELIMLAETARLTGKPCGPMLEQEFLNGSRPMYVWSITGPCELLQPVLPPYSLVDHAEPIGTPRNCRVFWGSTGTGKSRRAWEEAGMGAYPKDPRTKFWCGYHGQVHVVIDEFRGGIDIGHLLRWLDRYPVQVEIKGSSTPLMATSYWITSNLAPTDWYPDVDHLTYQALLRRLEIFEMSELSQ